MRAPVKKKRPFLRVVVAILVLAIGTTGILVYIGLNHAFFNLSEITIRGNVLASDEELHAASGASIQGNIFTFDTGSLREKFMALDNIREVTITKKYPHTLDVYVREAYVLGSFVSDGALYYLDESLTVVDRKTVALKDGAIAKELVGLVDAPVTVGQKLSETTDKGKLLLELKEHPFFQGITKIDFGLEENIRIIYNNIIIDFGSIEKTAYKFNVIERIEDEVGKKADVTIKEIKLNAGDHPIVVTNRGVETPIEALTETIVEESATEETASI